MIERNLPSGRLLIIGLDCAEPSLVFHRFRDRLPVLSRLTSACIHGPLRSTDPPLTIPAWSCMVTGRDPGELGLYGIRNRADYSYAPLRIATAADVRAPRLWQLAGDVGKRSIVVGVPQTYPVSPLNGWLVSGMLAPDTHARFTYPDELKSEVESVSGGYIIDVDDFRRVPPEALKEQIFLMTRKRFRTFRHLLRTRPWDFAMMVEIGLDRLQHCFWHYWDEAHPLHNPLNPFKDVLPSYYRLLDDEIGETLALIPDDTTVFIVSDHGAQAMHGGVRINEWLMERGLLTLKHTPPGPAPLDREWIDWPRTFAWGEGGYYGRIFLNIRGREPQGILPPESVETFKRRLADGLERMVGPAGERLDTRVIFPREHFSECNGLPPDLMVYFGNLAWRSLAEVGTGSVLTTKNDTGPDGANHALYGIFLSNIPVEHARETPPFDILDVTPTALNVLGIRPPDGLKGSNIIDTITHSER